VDFSSAFNTIIPALLQDKLSQLHVPDSTLRWITDFLSDRRQHVRLGKHSVKLLKFADDTTLIGLICGEDESAYRWEIDHLVTWCRHN
ncbi:hypothetical protein LDENG_00036170, partial [Lucifuga dentata]